MYPPGAEVVGKKAVEGGWGLVRSWLKSKRELEHQIEERDRRIHQLEAELAEVRSGKLVFEQLKSELKCRPGDDPMYWRKDGTDGPFCHLCLDADHKLIRLINGNREGSYYCSLHKEYVETAERREKNRQPVHVPRRYRPGGPWS